MAPTSPPPELSLGPQPSLATSRAELHRKLSNVDYHLFPCQQSNLGIRQSFPHRYLNPSTFHRPKTAWGGWALFLPLAKSQILLLVNFFQTTKQSTSHTVGNASIKVVSSSLPRQLSSSPSCDPDFPVNFLKLPRYPHFSPIQRPDVRNPVPHQHNR